MAYTTTLRSGSIRLVSSSSDYDFGTGGMTMSDIAISSWSSTERQGDTSESVVFHLFS